MKKKIFGFRGEDYAGMVEGIALAEDGRIIAHTISKTVDDIARDLGLDGTTTYKHKAYNKHFPEGWIGVFVPPSQEDSNAEFQGALKKLIAVKDEDDGSDFTPNESE